MSEKPRLDGDAEILIANQSDATYTFRESGYTGSVYVAVWDPYVTSSDPRDAYSSHRLDEWLATESGLTLTEDELWRLVEQIEEMILYPEPELI